MAASLMPIPPPLAAVRASAASSSGGHHQKSDSQRKSSWWTPLFGWSAEPDYITDAGTTDNRRKNTLPARSGGVVSESDPSDQRSAVRSRVVSPGNFTEEKARKLRMLTTETESFHDAMYHSAIASRLASDFSDRSDLS